MKLQLLNVSSYSPGLVSMQRTPLLRAELRPTKVQEPRHG